MSDFWYDIYLEFVMDGFAQKLQYFAEENIMLEVPFFQRPYVWNSDNWESLLDSILSEQDKHMPFIGSFIFQQTKNDKTFMIIDGQQRLMTISVMIKAFLDVYGSKVGGNVANAFKNIIYELNVTDDLYSIQVPRITPSNSDKPGFDLVMSENVDESKIKDEARGIDGAYLFFRKHFTRMPDSDLKKFGAKIITKNKFFIIINLEISDDEQKIFDSVNSLGQRLTNADIIKNYIYQKLRSFSNDESYQSKVMGIYQSNWDEPFYGDGKKDFWYKEITLGKIATTHLEEFLKDFATVKGFFKSSDNNGLINAYKTYVDGLPCNDLISLTQSMKSYADSYYVMINEFDKENDFRISNVLNTTLLIMRELSITTFYPVLLKLENEKIVSKDSIMHSLQKFILTRLLYGASNKNYNKISESLLEKIDSNECEKYLEDYNENSGLQLRNFPSGISYIKSNKNAALILFLIEMVRRNKSGEEKYSDTLMYNKTLEHIMPQNFKNWGSVPCYDYDADGNSIVVTKPDNIQEVRSRKVYSIGNMTLLNGPLNTSVGNDVFEIKINGKTSGKSKKEGIRKFVGTLSLADEIVKTYDAQKKWDERDIDKRANSLFMELNDYYGFSSTYTPKNVSIIYTSAFDTGELSTAEVKKTLDDDFLKNEAIGVVVKESIKYLMANELLSDQDICDLLDQKFSYNKLGCWLPALSVQPDSYNKKRYYRDPLQYKGNHYYLCSEWYRKDRERIVTWVKSKL